MSQAAPQPKSLLSAARFRVLPLLLASTVASIVASIGLPPAYAQVADAALEEEEQVVAIDVLVRFDRSRDTAWIRSRWSPSGLGAEDFVVRVDGEEKPVIGVQAFEDMPNDGAGGWTQLVYVDCRMTSAAHLQWAAAALADQADALTALGPVEVVVADPAAKTLLAPSADSEVVRSVLLQLARTETCRDLYAELRSEVLDTLVDQPAEVHEATIRDAVTAERGLTESSRLALSTKLTDGIRREGGAQKVLYLVHAGFDRQSLDFYRQRSDAAIEDTVPLLDPEDLADVVASYGWTVVALGPRAEPVETSGGQIGSWFFQPAVGAAEREEQTLEEHMAARVSPASPLDDGDPWNSFVGGIKGKLQERRDPGKAEGYLELGMALFGQGKYERAVDAYEKALYHFADAPKTRDRQVETLVHLGNALAAAGNGDRGRRAIEAAIHRSPELAEAQGAVSVELGDRGHLDLVEATAGTEVDDPESLARAVERLDGRVRLTFQLAGAPSGRLLPLEVEYTGTTPIEHVGWTRSSTPEEVAAARLLRLLDDEIRDEAVDQGDLDLWNALTEDGRIDLGPLLAEAGLDAAGPAGPTLRYSTAYTTPTGTPTHVEHRILADDERLLEVEAPNDAYLVAVVLEDLETGAWGAVLMGD